MDELQKKLLLELLKKKSDTDIQQINASLDARQQYLKSLISQGMSAKDAEQMARQPMFNQPKSIFEFQYSQPIYEEVNKAQIPANEQIQMHNEWAGKPTEQYYLKPEEPQIIQDNEMYRKKLLQDILSLPKRTV